MNIRIGISLVLAVLLVAAIVVYGPSFEPVEVTAMPSNRSETRAVLPVAEPVILGTDGAPTEVALNAANVSSRNGLVKDADPITVQRLQVWLESTFLPSQKFLSRHWLVEIDGDELGAAIRASVEANSIANADGSLVESSENSMIFDLFPDRSYQVVFYMISEGRYGYLHARGKIYGGNGQRSYFKIEIAPNREILGTIAMHDGLFSIRPSPEYPVHVVTEIDKKARQEKIVFY